MEQAVVYARYSSHNQSELSIEGQLDAAYKYAEQHGLNIIRTYEDRAKTGTNDKRPGFQQMLSDCKKHDFTVIIVWKVDRFGRNKEEITFNKYKCKKEGVRVEYVAESIGEGNEAVILESVLEGMAEYYSKQLSTNVKRGMAAAKAKGIWNGGKPPYGMYPVDKKLVPDPEYVPKIQQMFQDYVDGYTHEKIGLKYNIPKPSVRIILRHKIYRGLIVDPVVFDLVQERLDERAKRRSTKDEVKRMYIFTGKLYCTCGGHMYGSETRGIRYYICNNRRAVPKCTMPALSATKWEKAIVEAAREAISDTDSVIDEVWERYKQLKASAEPPRMALERVRKAEKGMENIMRAVEQGMDFELVRERLSALQREKEEAMSEVEKYKSQNMYNLTKEDIRTYLKESLDVKEDSVLVDRYVDKVIWDGQNIIIEMRVCPDICVNTSMAKRIILNTEKN